MPVFVSDLQGLQKHFVDLFQIETSGFDEDICKFELMLDIFLAHPPVPRVPVLPASAKDEGAVMGFELLAVAVVRGDRRLS